MTRCGPLFPNIGEPVLRRFFWIVLLTLSLTTICQAKGTYLGKLSVNPRGPDSIGNPDGLYGSNLSPFSIHNPAGRYGSEVSNVSATNPHATRPPKLYDRTGIYRGRLSANPHLPDSTSNPYGRYGSKSSPDSINNPYGAGMPGRIDSPNNPYGEGMSLYADDDVHHK